MSGAILFFVSLVFSAPPPSSRLDPMVERALLAAEKKALGLRDDVNARADEAVDDVSELIAFETIAPFPLLRGKEPLLLRKSISGSESRLKNAAAQLAAQDVAIDRLLDAAYRRYAARRAQSYQALVRLMLLHWSILVRREARGLLHTHALEFRGSPACRADLLQTQILWRFFDIVSLPDLDDGDRGRAVLALRTLADQLTCLDPERTVAADAYVASAFERLVRAIDRHRLRPLLHGVIDKASPVMLLFYDASKFAGSKSQSFRWWQANGGVVRAYLSTGASLFSWLGFWLKDRRSGALVALRATCKDQRATGLCVDGMRFIESIARPDHLGNGDCAFLDMIRRGGGPNGYLCLGRVCATTADCPPNVRCDLHREKLGCPKGQSTMFGVPCAELVALCNSGSGGGGASGGGGGANGRVCGGGASGLRDPVLRCAVEARKNPGQKIIQCLAEADDLCASPFERAAKELAWQQENGPASVRCNPFVKVDGDDPNHFIPNGWREHDCRAPGSCNDQARDRPPTGDRGSEPAGPPEERGNPPRGWADSSRRADSTISDDYWRDRAQRVIEGATGRSFPNYRDAYARAQGSLRDPARVYFVQGDRNAPDGTWPRYINPSLGLYRPSTNIFVFNTPLLEASAQRAGDPNRGFEWRNARSTQNVIIHEFLHALLRELGFEVDNTLQHSILRRIGYDCAADSINCSSCSADASRANEIAQCLDANPVPPPPSVAMPLPDDVKAEGWFACFTEVTIDRSVNYQRCQRIDCAFPQECDAATGKCSSPSAIAEPSGPRAVCAFVDCAEGLPVFDGFGRCLCRNNAVSAYPALELP